MADAIAISQTWDNSWSSGRHSTRLHDMALLRVPRSCKASRRRAAWSPPCRQTKYRVCSSDLVIDSDLAAISHRAMIFIHGENLSARYGEALKERKSTLGARHRPPTGCSPRFGGPVAGLTHGLPTSCSDYYYTFRPR